MWEGGERVVDALDSRSQSPANIRDSQRGILLLLGFWSRGEKREQSFSSTLAEETSHLKFWGTMCPELYQILAKS